MGSVFSFGFSYSANRPARVSVLSALSWPVVQFGELFRHGGIQLVQTEEGAVAQRRQHPSLNLLHPIFREGFIPWMAHAGWDNANPVMPRQRQIRLVQAPDRKSWRE